MPRTRSASTSSSPPATGAAASSAAPASAAAHSTPAATAPAPAATAPAPATTTAVPATAPPAVPATITLPAEFITQQVAVLQQLAQSLSAIDIPGSRDITKGLPKFSGKNADYALWKRQFETTLYQKGIDITSAAAVQTHDTRVKHALINHLDPINVHLVDQPGFSGLQMWETLVRKYESSDPTVIQALRDQLRTAAIRNDADAYIAHISSLVTQLRRRGINVTEADHVQYLVNGLSTSYVSVADHLLNPTADRALTTVEAHIRNVARSLYHQRSSGVNSVDKHPPALPLPVSATTSSTTGPSRGQSARKCPRCRTGSHHVSQCVIPCRLCKRTGHSESKCSKKKQPSKHKRHGGSNAIRSADTDNWLVDSGSDYTISPHRDRIAGYEEVSGLHARVANGAHLRLLGRGFTTLRQGEHTLRVQVYHAPAASQNILSLKDLCNYGFSAEICDGRVTLRNGSVTFDAPDFILTCSTSPLTGGFSCAVSDVSKWHTRMGHADPRMVARLHEHAHGVPPLKEEQLDCDACVVGKSKRAAAPRARSLKTTARGQVVHVDLVKFPMPDLFGNHYGILFLDDFSRLVSPYFLKAKTENTMALRQYYKLNPDIVVLRSDNAPDLIAGDFASCCDELGIVQQWTDAYTPQMNGRVESKIAVLTAMTRTLLLAQDLPAPLWSCAFSTAAYLRNRSLTQATGVHRTPYERFHGTKPNLEHLRIFGCLAYVHRPGDTRAHKLQATSAPAVFVGYTDNTFQYQLYCPTSNRIFRSRSVVFREDVSGSTLISLDHTLRRQQAAFEAKHKRRLQRPQPLPQDAPTDQQPDDILAPRMTTATDPPPLCLADLETAIPSTLAVQQQPDATPDPITYAEAMRTNPDGWSKAMQEEIQALHDLQVYELVPFAGQANIVTCKWVYRTKTNANGLPVRLKARLVGRGFTQRHGVDFFDTYAPTGNAQVLRVLLSVAASKHLQAFHLDVRAAFLNAKLEEEVYMHPPPGMDVPRGFILKLHKSLYGLRQAGRNWHLNAVQRLLAANFTQTSLEPCVFISTGDPFSGLVIVKMHVDDFLVLVECNEDMDVLVAHMREKYEIRHEPLEHYLNLSIKITEDGSIYAAQPNNINSLISSARVSGCKPVYTPLDADLPPLTGTGADTKLYAHLVGALGHIARFTRPDISFTFGVLARYQKAPDRTHMQLARRAVRYLSCNPARGLLFRPTTIMLSAYVDSDFAGDTQDRKSTSGFVIFLGSNLVHWSSTKQRIVALSSAEAEYVAICDVTREIMYFRTLLSDLGFPQTDPTVVYSDSQSAIAMATGECISRHSKHMDVRYHYIREQIAQRTITLRYIPSNDNLADPFTKQLPRLAHTELTSRLMANNAPNA